MITRLLTVLALVTGVYLAPWWAVLVAAVAGLLVFNLFFEAILVAWLLDTVYTSLNFWGPLPWFTVALTVLFVVAVWLKGNFRARRTAPGSISHLV